MTVPTATDILAIIDTGTYNVTFQTYDIEQLEKRRRYPSIEVYKDVPASQQNDKKQTQTRYNFKIRIFQKLLSKEISSKINTDQEQAENEIESLLDSASLGDHKILTESLSWDRDQQRTYHPYYVISTLNLTIVGVKTTVITTDALLVFSKNNSTVNSAPASDYTYSEIFDTEIMEGYHTHEEQVTVSPVSPGVPIRFRGGYYSRFLTHMAVKSTDFGTTGDKVNQLNTLLSSSQEKPIIGLVFTDKTTDTPTTHQIQEAITVDIDRVERAYTYNDLIVYRIYGFLTKPSVISVS
jgi:hypothetical protein